MNTRTPLLTLLLAAALGAASACGGGGGGITPLPTTTGTISGSVLVDASVPLVPGAGGARITSRLIDPGDSIQGIPGPVNPAANGTFQLNSVPVSATNLYLQLDFATTIDLFGLGVSETPVRLNMPVRVAAGETTTTFQAVRLATAGASPIGLLLDFSNGGPDGTRRINMLIDFRSGTLTADLNGDGTFDDSPSVDDNRDCIADDQNRFDDDPSGFTEIEREGAVEATTNDTITIAGSTFKIVTTTSIFNKDTSETLDLADFNVGDAADVKGFQSGSDLIATRLRLDDKLEDDDPVDPIPGTIEIEREDVLLEAKTATTVTAGGLTWTIVPTTVFEEGDSPHAPLTFDDFVVGSIIDIKGKETRPASSGLTATRLRLETEGDPGGFEIEREGRITAIDAETITVAGTTFRVPPGIPVFDKDTEAPIAYGSLQVDDFVRVKGTQTETENVATEIRFDPDSDDPPGGGGGGDDDPPDGTEVEREGTVAAVTATSLTIADVTFVVTPTTEIVDKDTDEPLTLADFAVGTPADAKGILIDGEVLATRIRRDDS